MYSLGRQPVVGVEEDFEPCKECKEIGVTLRLFHEPQATRDIHR